MRSKDLSEREQTLELTLRNVFLAVNIFPHFLVADPRKIHQRTSAQTRRTYYHLFQSNARRRLCISKLESIWKCKSYVYVFILLHRINKNEKKRMDRKSFYVWGAEPIACERRRIWHRHSKQNNKCWLSNRIPALGKYQPKIYYYSLAVVACDGVRLPGRWARGAEPHIKMGYSKSFQCAMCVHCKFSLFSVHSAAFNVCGCTEAWCCCCYLDNTWRIFAHKLFSYKSMFG